MHCVARPLAAGFTLLELLVTVAVIAILAALALPSVQAPLVRQQVVDSAALINVAKTAVAGKWSTLQKLPLDNPEAGLPAADKLVGSYVSSVTVEAGAVHVMFGNQANGALKGHTLSFRPAVVDGAPMVPVAWVCGPAPTPDKMSVKGTDRTDIAPKYLPINCRAG
ncbi:MAG TPA: pilin [Burkholderiaceae bacterium]|nr:pilin [Burkholderiaceae bacterium]